MSTINNGLPDFGPAAPAVTPAPAQGETPESEAAQREFESGHGYPLAVHVEFAKRLERELAQKTFQEEYTRRTNNEISHKLTMQESELAALRDDRQRLDWLEKAHLSASAITENWGDENVLWWQITKGKKSLLGHPEPTLRAAIDAARQSSSKATHQQGEGA